MRVTRFIGRSTFGSRPIARMPETSWSSGFQRVSFGRRGSQACARAEVLVDGTVYDTPPVQQVQTGSAVKLRVSDDAMSALRSGRAATLRLPVLYRSGERTIRVRFGLRGSSKSLGAAQCRRQRTPPQVAERLVQNPDQLAGLMRASNNLCREGRLGTAITTRSMNFVNPPARLIWGLNAASANVATHTVLTKAYEALIRQIGCGSKEYNALIEDALRFIQRY